MIYIENLYNNKIENDFEILKIFKKIFENLNESFRNFITKIQENCNDCYIYLRQTRIELFLFQTN